MYCIHYINVHVLGLVDAWISNIDMVHQSTSFNEDDNLCKILNWIMLVLLHTYFGFHHLYVIDYSICHVGFTNAKQLNIYLVTSPLTTVHVII